LDKTAPEINISARSLKIGQKEYLYPGSFIEFFVLDDDENVESYIWINGERSYSKRYRVSKKDDFLRCTVFAKDSAGNFINFTKNFYVDNTPPQLKIISLTNLLEIYVKDDTILSEVKTYIGERLFFGEKIDLKQFKIGVYDLSFVAIDIFNNTNKEEYILRITNNEGIFRGIVEGK